MENNISEEKYRNTVGKLMKINRLHRSIFENTVSSLGIHHSQHHLLIYLSARGEETPSQKEIADTFQISPAAVAVSLKKLEKLGYVKRESVSDDNRIKKILITDKGRNIVEQTITMFGATDRNVFSGFSDEELKDFNFYLDRALENIEKITGESNSATGGKNERQE